MAYNPSPKVRAAESYAKKFGFDKVIIIGLNEAEGRISGTSYGSDKAKCDEAKKQMNTAYEAIKQGYEEPEQGELLPRQPKSRAYDR